MNKISKSSYKTNLSTIESFVGKLKLYPAFLNPNLEKCLPSEIRQKTLNYLYPDLYNIQLSRLNDEDEDNSENQSDQSNQRTKPNDYNSDGCLKSTNAQVDNHIVCQSHTRSHFKLLFKNHDQMLTSQENRLLSVKTSSNITLKLEKKIVEFCKWNEKNYPCDTELDLDTLTLIKIFLVSYDKGPFMWVPIKIEPVNNSKYTKAIFKNLLMSQTNTSPADKTSSSSSFILESKSNDTSSFDSISEKQLVKKTKSQLVKNNKTEKSDDLNHRKKKKNIETTTNKLLKCSGIKLFVDYYKRRKNSQMPYSLQSTISSRFKKIYIQTTRN